MDIPRGHAMLPLNEGDFLDFIYNYFKAEYSPIRSLWSTATAVPNSPHRWQTMGNELFPLSFRPANAQAQKDLDSLDYFLRKWNLDATFIRGIVIRFAKYEEHLRMEKKLYECCRVDLMVRKALKEKHLLDKLWPSPTPRNIPQALLQQGVQVRKWYGDMFGKYFKKLHSVEDFTLCPEVDAHIKTSTMLMLVPFVDHLVFGTVDPIIPIVARGAGYSNTAGWKQAKEREGTASFGEPARFDIRLDGQVEDTIFNGVIRQCQCLKCGTKRDVNVNISIEPSLDSTTHTKKQKPRDPPRGQSSRTAQKYSPGYSMPGVNDTTTAPQLPQRPSHNASLQDEISPASPPQKKPCPACTFLNHPDLTACEMCQTDLPQTSIPKPPSPSPASSSSQRQSNSTPKGPSHAHSASTPTNQTSSSYRPALPNRQSISSTLFSIFPFTQQGQSEHHAHLPVTQPTTTTSMTETGTGTSTQISQSSPEVEVEQTPPTLPTRKQSNVTPPPQSQTNTHQMTMMPLTSPPASSPTHPRYMPAGLPQNLMDDFVPVASPGFAAEQGAEEDAGWGEIRGDEWGGLNKTGDEGGIRIGKNEVEMPRSEAEAGWGSASMNRDAEEEEVEEGKKGRTSTEGMIDLDAVAREEMGVWGERED
jgi:hypothetical protein